jgi:Pyruvate/2-oxoacid:ferredoxin oxidoreductase gamma subunit
LQNWDGNEWINSELKTTTYDSNNNAVLVLNQKWDQSEWENVSQAEYAYDSIITKPVFYIKNIQMESSLITLTLNTITIKTITL